MSLLERHVAGIFDYAGMFPPAALSYDAALANAAMFWKRLRRPHLVANDFVLGADLLDRLDVAELRTLGAADAKTFRVCFLAGELGPETLALADKIVKFNAAHGNGPIPLRVVSFETKATPGAFADHAALAATLDDVRAKLAASAVRVYLEPLFNDALWLERSKEVFQVLGATHGVGLKIRGTGQTAATNRAFAPVVRAVVERKLPFKATAGLHHPILEERYGNNLGFLNLVTCLRLRQAKGADFPDEAMDMILEENDAGAYAFDASLRWRDFSLTEDEVKAAKEAVPFSIGSCSLDEPDADLTRLFGAPKEDCAFCV